MKNFCFPILFLFSLLYSCKTDQPQSDFEKFTGRWSLAIVESKNDSLALWTPRQDHYKNRQGFIIYDGLGGMGVHHVTENYEHYKFESDGPLDSLTNNDLRHLADNFVYFGKYRINDSAKIIEHHIESTNFQHMWGTIAKRKYEFNADTLTLNPVTNGFPKTRLRWVKVNERNEGSL